MSTKKAEIIFNNLPGPWIKKKAKGGESPSDLRRRVKHFIKHLIKRHKGNTVLVITHSGVIRMFLSILLNIPLEKAFGLIKISNAAGFLITLKDKDVKLVRRYGAY